MRSTTDTSSAGPRFGPSNGEHEGRRGAPATWRPDALAGPLVAALLAIQPLAAQQCSNGLPGFGSIGVGEFECVGGSCAVNMRTGDPYAHSFSTEPRLRDIAPWADVLHEGDVLVAVDGRLITTAEGGRRLGSVKPGQDVKLTLRREGREIQAWLTARQSCELPRLEVTSGNGLGWSYTVRSDSTSLWTRGPAAGDSTWTGPFFGRDSTGLAFGVSTGNGFVAGFASGTGLWFGGKPPVEFGVELTCDDCGWRRTGGGVSFVTDVFPVVASIEKGGPADASGLAVGDRLLTVSGLPITSAEAGRVLGSLEPGEAVTLEVRRGDRIVEISIEPRAPDDRRQRW